MGHVSWLVTYPKALDNSTDRAKKEGLSHAMDQTQPPEMFNALPKSTSKSPSMVVNGLINPIALSSDNGKLIANIHHDLLNCSKECHFLNVIHCPVDLFSSFSKP